MLTLINSFLVLHVIHITFITVISMVHHIRITLKKATIQQKTKGKSLMRVGERKRELEVEEISYASMIQCE